MNEFDRKKLTFEQAEGLEELPSQLELKQVSPLMKSLLWAAVYESLEPANPHSKFTRIRSPWYDILRDFWVQRQHQAIDEFKGTWPVEIPDVRYRVYSSDYIKALGFIQFALRHRDCPERLPIAISKALTSSRAAYRLIDDNTIAPIASEYEASTLQNAFANLAASEFNGAREHLRNAATEATTGNWAASVRESIHSVESVARSMVPNSNGLGPALAELGKNGHIHEALKKGFLAIYGFTSDEKGIRHPLLDDPQSNVDETDALFMLGACASFVTYLIQKGRKVGLVR